ncbi:MAG: glutamine-hydrolyzing GMP synthase, partial [Prevotella sp.]|nr:glutamine-hydrolyzing GMP synthase [Prevotella sp.]
MQKIIILDFGSQTTQLIARRIRELNTFCELLPYNKYPDDDSGVIGVILSGSPYSVYAPEAFRTDLARFIGRLPVLGICYGAQYIAYTGGGRVEQAGTREYGRQHLCNIDTTDPLLKGITDGSQIWMSHSDTITALPQGATTIASTAAITNAAYCIKAYNGGHAGVWGVQFHPEVYHTTDGVRLLRNFIVDICGSRQDWSPNSFINTAINDIRALVGNDRVVLG